MFNQFTDVMRLRIAPYDSLVKEVAALVSNQRAQSALKARGLQCQAVAWEDTSRNKGSCWGSNISDMTLCVGSTRMPIIRSPNFEDVTVDLSSDKLPMLVVGNERGSSLTKVTLREYLENFNQYCGAPSASPMNLYHSRDANVLTSAQACVLPTNSGKVEFGVDLYNYQSSRDEPAVLVIMATAYGTSAQVVSGGNTVLYFNGNGTGHLFKAERLSDYRLSQGKPTSGPMTSEEKSLNGIYIFQVPLKVRERTRSPNFVLCSMDNGMMENCCLEAMPKMAMKSCGSRGMERAILSVGEEKGPFKGILNSSGSPYKLERDTDRPVRLTVQFYMCSDTADIAEANINDICDQIRKIYDQGCGEGSLVVDHNVPKPGIPTEKKTERPTATTYTPSHLNNGIL